ncbi:MAG: D-alanyl-D-alanine carboxypeptidase family protein [Evtepia sp.]
MTNAVGRCFTYFSPHLHTLKGLQFHWEVCYEKLCALALCLALCVGLLPSAAWAAGPEVKAKAVLLMEKSTGEILYEEHGEEPLELASVTKVMTMLLIMEALEDGTLTPDTMVAVSANAAGMGGSQVYMKEGETFSVHDMLKAIAVASGNDACVAMAEHLAGSEAAFVERMNARAAELGMENTVFCNCTGLPAEGHHSTALDIALMSRELIRKHPDIRTYTTIWMDTVRDGSFQLANTNKLIRFYDGATGLENRLHLDGALYCISATADEGWHGADRRGPRLPHLRRPLRGRQSPAQLRLRRGTAW